MNGLVNGKYLQTGKAIALLEFIQRHTFTILYDPLRVEQT